MLRKLIVGVIVANFVLILAGVISTTDNMLPSIFAYNTTISGPAYATVPEIVGLISQGIRRIPRTAPPNANPWNYPNSTSFDFGTLYYDEAQGYFIGEDWYCVLMIPVTSGNTFSITETGTALTGSQGAIPDTAFLQIPDYQYEDEWSPGQDQGEMPAGAYCDEPSSAVGQHNVYVSPTFGSSRILRGIITIGGPALGQTYPDNWSRGHDGSVGQGTQQFYEQWDPINMGDALPGIYQGSVTFTLNLI